MARWRRWRRWRDRIESATSYTIASAQSIITPAIIQFLDAAAMICAVLANVDRPGA